MSGRAMVWKQSSLCSYQKSETIYLKITISEDIRPSQPSFNQFKSTFYTHAQWLSRLWCRAIIALIHTDQCGIGGQNGYDRLAKKIAKRFDHLEQRLNEMYARFDAIETKMAAELVMPSTFI